MKRVEIFIIIILSFLCVLPSVGQDTEIINTGTWEYQSNGNGWTILKYLGNETSVDIPYQFDGIYVTEIGAEAFLNHLTMKRVSIPSQVTKIGKSAFQGCSALTDVTLPFAITSIPESCFKYCTALELITLPQTLTGIGKEAFAFCSSLREINIPFKVTSVGESAFENCTSLNYIYVQQRLSNVGANAFTNTAWLSRQTDEYVFIGNSILLRYNGHEKNVTIPYGTVAISNAFEGNREIESVEIPETVLRIMQNAFKDCVNLQNVTLPEYTTTLGAGAFMGCRSLETAELDAQLSSLGADAFNGCERLESLLIPAKIRNIPARFTANCPYLKEVILPETVTKIDKSSFSGSTNVTLFLSPMFEETDVLDENDVNWSWYQEQNEDFIYTLGPEDAAIVRYIGAGGDVEIPAELDGMPVTSIGPGAFQNSPTVRRVIVPASVTSVGDWAFSYMDILEMIRFEEGPVNLGSSVFTGCPKLREIRVSNRLRNWGTDAFGTNSAVSICMPSWAKNARTLREVGYPVKDETECTDIRGGWEDAAESFSAEALCGNCWYEQSDIIQLPEGLRSLSPDLLNATGDSLILLIPESVEYIDKAILEDRTVTIIGKPGTAAEDFARVWGVKFLVKLAFEK